MTPGIRNARRRRTKAQELNITPLIDMVFILLIFFLVTTSFVKESGVTVERPVARTAETKDKTSLVIGVDEKGVVYIGGQTVDLRMIRPHVDRYLSETPEGAAVIVADKSAPTGVVVQVLDECRLTGIKELNLAARNPDR